MSASDTYIFLDTCSLLVSCWDMRRGDAVVFNPEKERQFWGVEVPTLARIGTIVLTKRNYDELEKLSKVHGDSKRPLLGERCAQVLARIAPLVKDKTISIVGDPNDPFADAILLSVALKFRTQKNLLFVTQDRALATDLIAISNFQSVRPRNGYELKVRRLNAKGSIDCWHFKGEMSKANGGRSGAPMRKVSTSPNKCVESYASAQSPMQEWWR